MTREEAIKAITAWDFLDNDEKEAIETLIPELKESGDERIRKEIISALKNANYKGVYDKHLAWLEKQAPKQEWSDEDEELLQHCCGAVAAADYYTLEDKEEMENWLKSLKQRNL